jgi:hypothetical protein
MFCTTSGKSLLSNLSCYFKTFKRNGYFSFRGTLMRQISNAKVSYSNARKNSDGYQKILGLENVEICKILNDVQSSSLVPFAKSFIEYIKSVSSGNFIDACNLTGEIYAYNITMANMSSFELFPAGEYMGTILYFDDLDSKILNITLQYRLIKF